MQNGFTLVELMVSVTLFTIAMIISISTLLVILDANAKAQAVSTAMTNISFAVDSMSREVRTGRTHHCVNSATLGSGSLPDEPRDCPDGENAIVFTREVDDERMGYRFNLGEHRIEQRGMTPSNDWLPITSSDVVIERFEIVVTGAEGAQDSDYEQPEISIVIAGHVESGPNSQTDFSLQTKVVQRVIDL